MRARKRNLEPWDPEAQYKGSGACAAPFERREHSQSKRGMMRAATRARRGEGEGANSALNTEQEFKGGPRNNASNYLLPPWSVAQRIYILFVQAPVASYTSTI